jgi:hypothetical protein
MAGGRPSKFKAEFVEQARKLAALGATDRDAAEFFGVNEATLHRWKHTQPEFCEALKVGKDAADQRVEQSLYRKAVGYTQDDTHFSSYEGVVTATPYVKHIPPDTTACIFWLKNRQPEEWRDKQVVEHQGEVEVTDARERLARIVAGHTAAAGVVEGSGKPH